MKSHISFIKSVITNHLLAVTLLICCTFSMPATAVVILDIVVDQVNYFVEDDGITTKVFARFSSSQPVLLTGDWSIPNVSGGISTTFTINMKTAAGTSIFFNQPTGPGYRDSYGFMALEQLVGPFGGPVSYTQPDAIGFAKLGFENLGGGYLNGGAGGYGPVLSKWTGSLNMQKGWTAGGAFQLDGLTNNFAIGTYTVQAVDLPHNFYFDLGSRYWSNQFVDPGTNFAGLTAVPVPAAAWLFASGCLALFGISRKKASI